MNFDKKAFLRIGILAALFLLFMLGLQLYYKDNAAQKLEQVLKENKYVKNAKIYQENEIATIYVNFENVDNLMEAYNFVYDTIKSELKSKAFEVKIINASDSLAKQIYENEVQFILYEAIQTGQYAKMKSMLNEIENIYSNKCPLKIKTYIDSSNLYAQIECKEGRFYKVIDRLL